MVRTLSIRIFFLQLLSLLYLVLFGVQIFPKRRPPPNRVPKWPLTWQMLSISQDILSKDYAVSSPSWCRLDLQRHYQRSWCRPWSILLCSVSFATNTNLPSGDEPFFALQVSSISVLLTHPRRIDIEIGTYIDVDISIDLEIYTLSFVPDAHKLASPITSILTKCRSLSLLLRQMRSRDRRSLKSALFFSPGLQLPAPTWRILKTTSKNLFVSSMVCVEQNLSRIIMKMFASNSKWYPWSVQG